MALPFLESIMRETQILEKTSKSGTESASKSGTESRICASCGNTLKEDSTYCRKCGSKPEIAFPDLNTSQNSKSGSKSGVSPLKGSPEYSEFVDQQMKRDLRRIGPNTSRREKMNYRDAFKAKLSLVAPTKENHRPVWR